MSIKDRLNKVKVAQKLRELQAADTTFQEELVSGTNIKTINSNSILGSGNLVVGGSGYSEGTSFPGSPTSGDKFYRTDLNWLCFYDGTRWLTCHEYAVGFPQKSDTIATSNELIARAQVRSDFGIYMTKWESCSRVITTNNGSNYWTVEVCYQDSAAATTQISSFTTAADAANTIYAKSTSIASVLSSSALTLFVRVVKSVGSPGNIVAPSELYYRLIVT